MKLSNILALFATTLALCAVTVHAQPQAWPTKPVHITTIFPAGAGPEVLLRLVAERLQRKWGQPVIVENKPGGNGFIAVDSFKRASSSADGYELIQLDNQLLVAYPTLYKKLPYDPVKDFDPVLPLAKTYFYICVSAGSKYKTVGDIIAAAKANPGKLNYGSWAVGSGVHLGSALLESLTGTEMVHVIYKETSMLYAAVANGEIDFAIGSMATAGAMQRSGRLKFIAVTGPNRHPAFPEVPTVVESGGPPGFDVSGVTTLAAPRGVPRNVVDKIRRDVDAVLAEPEVQERFAAFGYERFSATREQYSAFLASESTKWADIIRRAKVSLD